MRYRRKRSQVIFYAVFSKLEHLASLALTKTPCGGEGVVSTLRLRKLRLDILSDWSQASQLKSA